MNLFPIRLLVSVRDAAEAEAALRGGEAGATGGLSASACATGSPLTIGSPLVIRVRRATDT